MDTKIPKFRRCVIQNFPFIEADFDALTDYGLVSKIVEYLNKVIDTANTLSEDFVVLKNYVDNYFDNLDVQEEINNKLEEMAEDGSLLSLFGNYTGYITPKMFGAEEGTSADQSDKLKDCIDYAIENNIKEIILNGAYLIDDTTALEFTGVDGLVIRDGTIYVHETSDNLSNGFKVLSFTNSSNIVLDNIKVIETLPEARTRNLYQGGFYFTGCTNCAVRNCYFENTYSGVVFKTGNSKCIAENNKIKVNYHSEQFASSAILSYGSDDVVIKNNDVVGEFYDGTISVYGGSDNNIVDGNIIKGIYDQSPIWLSEGITIDAACENTIVVNNNVYGQYYGIDNKNDSRNTLIANNTVRGCKVAITDRPGEENKQTFNCQIDNNQIIIEKSWDSTGSLANILFEEIYYYVGIYCGQRLSADVKNNKITLWKTISSKTVCGILCSASTTSTTNTYASQFDVHNNSIEFATGFSSDTSMAGSNSAGIYYKNVLKGSIIGNTLKVDATANTYNMIMFAGANTYVYVTNNTFLATSQDNHNFVNMDESATVTNSKVVRNNLKLCKPKFNLGSFSNEVEMRSYNVVAHQMPPQDFTYDVWTKIGTITPRYGSLVRIKVDCVKSASGNKYLIGEYILSIQDSTVTVVATVAEEKSGLDIQFVHGTNTRDCDIQIKTGANINNFGELFVFDVIGDQPVTFA